MKVGDIMARYVEFAPAGASVAEAAELMGELDVGGVPVGAPDDLRGIVTDRDILFRVVARGLDSRETGIETVATNPVIGCGEGDRLQDAMDLMAAHSIRRLVVRDASGLVIGWLTLGDVARHLLVGSGALQEALAAATAPAEAAAAPAAVPASAPEAQPAAAAQPR